MAKTGRNEPCPCGSGKKYKFCHGRESPAPVIQNLDDVTDSSKLEAYEAYLHTLSEEERQSGPSFMEWLGKPNAASDVMRELKAALEGQSFRTIAEANAFMAARQEALNSAPLDELFGLSPNDMHAVFTERFEHCTNFVRLNWEAAAAPGARPILREFCDYVLDKIGTQGIKLSAAGYLPTALVKDASSTFLAAYVNFEAFEGRSSVSESSLPYFFKIRQLGEGLKLWKVKDGRLVAGSKAKAYARGSPTERFRFLFDELMDINWEFFTFERLPFFLEVFQNAWIFALYILHVKGKDFIPSRHLARFFLCAFPHQFGSYVDAVRAEPRVGSSLDMEDTLLEMACAHCSFTYPGELLGLIEYAPHTSWSEPQKIRRTALFEDLFTWKKPASSR